jgi:Protein of unknown function (DUF2752)
MDPAIAASPRPAPHGDERAPDPAPDGSHRDVHGQACAHGLDSGDGHHDCLEAGATGRARPRTERWGRLAGLAAAAGVTAYVGLVDPSQGGAYPLCPSRFLFGIDCPACGGLRGTHDLLRGDVVGALDHNLLLPLLLGVYAVVFAAWLLPLFGRPAPTLRPPRWLLATGIVVVATFTVLRNLPIAGLDFLASGT